MLRIGLKPETPETLTAAICVANMHRMLLICNSVSILRCAGGSHAGDPAAGVPPDWRGFSPLYIRYVVFQNARQLTLLRMPDKL